MEVLRDCEPVCERPPSVAPLGRRSGCAPLRHRDIRSSDSTDALCPATPEALLVVDNDLFSHWRTSHEYVRLGFDRYLSRHKRLPALASIVVFETLSGFPRDLSGSVESRLAEKSGRLQELVRSTEVLPFDLRAAELAAVIFTRLTRKQQRRNDLFIAATALAHGCGVATRNRKDFEAIGSLLPADFGLLYIDAWR